MSQGPRSVKGIDQRARQAARERAQEDGATIGQHINDLLLHEPGAAATARSTGTASKAADLRRLANRIDELSGRLDGVQSHSTRALSGVDKSILGVVGRFEQSGRAQAAALEQVAHVVRRIERSQQSLQKRVDDAGATEKLEETERALLELKGALLRLGDRVAKTQHASDTRAAELESRLEAVRNETGEGIERLEGAFSKAVDAAVARIEAKASQDGRQATDIAKRSTALTNDLLRRVEDIETRTRDAVGSLGETVSRITDRLSRTEGKSGTAFDVIQQSMESLERRVDDVQGAVSKAASTSDLKEEFQARFDRLADELSRPINEVRTELSRRIDAVRADTQPDRLDRAESTLKELKEQIARAETDHALAIASITKQIERLSASANDRLSALETRDFSQATRELREEMIGLLRTLETRQSTSESALRDAEDTTREIAGRMDDLADTVAQKLSASDARTASAIDSVGNQLLDATDRIRDHHAASFQALEKRIGDVERSTAERADEESERVAGIVDHRIRDSERRSAEAITQIGQQVARVADRLQTQQRDSLRTIEGRLSESSRAHAASLSEALTDITRRLDEISQSAADTIAPLQGTVSSLAVRVAQLEDRTVSPISEPAAVQSDDVLLEDLGPVSPPTGEDPLPLPSPPEHPDELEVGLAGVDPPPFDSPHEEDALFEAEDAPPAPPPPFPSDEEREAAKGTMAAFVASLERDGSSSGPAPKGDDSSADELVATLPDPGEVRADAGLMAEARRAAREGRRVDVTFLPGGRRPGIGRVPVVASAALALAVAGGGAWTVMRGKQDASGGTDAFARLDPFQPAAAEPESDPGAESALFDASDAGDAVTSETSESSAAGASPSASDDLFDAETTEGPAMTLEDAVADGDPVALYDTALTLLPTQNRARGVSLLKEAAAKGLVMAQFRLAKVFENGEGAPRDMAAARNWTEKAAIGGNVKAMHDLAVFYSEGDAGPQSYAAAAQWFRQAAELGLVDSQFNLAVLYEQGLGVTQDPVEAAFWFELAGRAADADGVRRARAILAQLTREEAEAASRRARAFNPQPIDPVANGEFGPRAWDVLDSTKILELQTMLDRLGYRIGDADGTLTSRTRDAIRRFQIDQGLVETGEPDADLMRSVRLATLNSGG